MTDEQYEDLKQVITDQMKITVNGKIDRLTQMVTDHIADDTEWKKDAQPVVDAVKAARQGTQWAIAWIGFIAGIVTIWQVLRVIILKK